MATIKEVAESAGVSVATVSRVVNHSGYVSNDLRERVETAMQRLDYKPSALARSLRRQETHTVGVLTPQLNQPFFSTLISAAEKALFAGDYRALICSSEADAGKESAYIDILLRQRVDGVILVPTDDSAENVKRLLRAKIPAVLIDRDFPELLINRVLTRQLLRRVSGRAASPRVGASPHRLDRRSTAQPGPARPDQRRPAGVQRLWRRVRPGFSARGQFARIRARLRIGVRTAATARSRRRRSSR